MSTWLSCIMMITTKCLVYTRSANRPSHKDVTKILDSTTAAWWYYGSLARAVMQSMHIPLYTTQKKFRITCYIIFLLAIVNPRSYIERDGYCMKLSQHFQWAWLVAPLHGWLDNYFRKLQKLRFSKNLRKVKHFKVCDLQSCSIIIIERTCFIRILVLR